MKSPQKFKLKNLGWNNQTMNENQITDMWFVLMWYSLSNMWMNVEIWSTTTKFYIAIVALLKEWKKNPGASIFFMEERKRF